MELSKEQNTWREEDEEEEDVRDVSLKRKMEDNISILKKKMKVQTNIWNVYVKDGGQSISDERALTVACEFLLRNVRDIVFKNLDGEIYDYAKTETWLSVLQKIDRAVSRPSKPTNIYFLTPTDEYDEEKLALFEFNLKEDIRKYEGSEEWETKNFFINSKISLGFAMVCNREMIESKSKKQVARLTQWSYSSAFQEILFHITRQMCQEIEGKSEQNLFPSDYLFVSETGFTRFLKIVVSSKTTGAPLTFDEIFGLEAEDEAAIGDIVMDLMEIKREDLSPNEYIFYTCSGARLKQNLKNGYCTLTPFAVLGVVIPIDFITSINERRLDKI